MIRELGELETAVMTLVWGSDTAVTVREAMERLRSDGRALAYTTVGSVMDNLHTKGRLHRTPDGRAFKYTPAGTRAQYAAGLMKRSLERSDDATASFAALFAALTADQWSALEAALPIARASAGQIDSARKGEISTGGTHGTT